MEPNKRNKTAGILLFLLLGMILSGCRFGYRNLNPGVVAPEIGKITIEGQYRFVEVMSLEEGKFVDNTNFSNFTADFTLDSARIGLELLDHPSYQSKLVDAYDFFVQKYSVNPERLKLYNESLEVVSISSPDRTFYDIFRLDEGHIAIAKGNNLIKLEKTVFSATNQAAINNQTGTEEVREGLELNTIITEPRAGVLIGLRDERSATSNLSNYRTLWITNDGEVQEVYEIDNILFPRKEFWKIEVISEKVNDRVMERLNIYPILGIQEENTADAKQATYGGKYIDLDFVGNNYVGISSTDNAYKSHDLMKYAKTLAIDQYTMYQGVGIQEISGVDGINTFMNSFEQIKQKNSDLESKALNQESFLHSFVLKRNRGHWMMVSRITTGAENSDEFIEVPIALKPSQSLIAYDELAVSWNKIIEKVPQAIDAVNAPGNSFLLIRTPKYLMMYMIIGENKLADKPMQMVEIKETEEIIMAEWARGDFVKRWTDVVVKQGEKIIFVQSKK
ncbi:MAG: hypothetical protein WBI17_04835 [Clostridiaceae bacterium]